MKNKYKSTIIYSLFFIALSSSVHAELAYNKVTRKFYSIDADRKVDQNEYHNTVISLFKIMHSDQTGDVNIIAKKVLQLLKSKKQLLAKEFCLNFKIIKLVY